MIADFAHTKMIVTMQSAVGQKRMRKSSHELSMQRTH